MGGFTLENEKQIVEEAKYDDEAFEVLYDFYFSKIYAYLFKRVGSHAVAEDLVSTTFLKVFKNLNNYKYQNCSFGAWVYRIATNNLNDYYRKNNKVLEVSLEEARELPDNNPSAEDLVDININKKQVRLVLLKLQPKYQKIINLKYFAQMNNQEIAEVMGIKKDNCRVLCHRALKKFSKLFQKYGQF